MFDLVRGEMTLNTNLPSKLSLAQTCIPAEWTTEMNIIILQIEHLRNGLLQVPGVDVLRTLPVAMLLTYLR